MLGGFEVAVGERHGIGVALAALPARQRAAVVLRFYDDLPVAGIARVMGCSAGAVKRYISDATHTLAERLRVAEDVAEERNSS